MNKSVSPSRTYVAMCSRNNFEGYHFKKFVLPETDSDLLSGDQKGTILKNNNETAAWYYLNRLDEFSCIDGCVSYEDILTVFQTKDDILAQLAEARELLKNIKQDVVSGYSSDITRDINTFFEEYPDWKEVKILAK